MSYTICVRRNTVQQIFDEFERRLKGDKQDVELANAITEEHLITRLRIGEQVSGPGAPKIYGDLTAHVLNAMVGEPASGVTVALYEVLGEKIQKVSESVTNVDGRADLLKGQPVPIGRYEMRFGIGDYFRKNTTPAVEPFFDVVPVRLFLDKPEESWHVPMITTPFNYSTHA